MAATGFQISASGLSCKAAAGYVQASGQAKSISEALTRRDHLELVALLELQGSGPRKVRLPQRYKQHVQRLNC